MRKRPQKQILGEEEIFSGGRRSADKLFPARFISSPLKFKALEEFTPHQYANVPR